jgi:HEAT repeat protein
LNELSQPNPLSEMIRIPILLSSIVELYREKQIFISDATRIDIYEAITKRLIARIDQEKSIQRFAFKIKDSDGTLKLDFLKQLAFDRLFTDEPEISGHHDTLRLVFKDEAILEKAKNYVRREGLSEINPIELTDDVKATALLREIGDDFYAFTHLTLHEYLAAKVLANHEDREKLFTLAYFNPSLVEMEVLPITLGLVNNAEHLYETLEQLSESLTYTNFRLQLRGLSYEARIENKRFLTITSRILNFMNEINLLESPYTESIIRSLIGIKGVRAEKIVEQISPLLEYEGENICLRTVRALEQLGNEKAVDSLIRALSNKNSFVRQEAAWALGKIEDMRAFDSLIVALDDVDAQVRGYVARALAKFRDEKASDDLLRAFRNVESGYRFRMEEALVDLGGEAIVHGLIEDLDNENRDVRFYAAKALGRIGNEKAVMPLINALNKDNSIPYAAAKALTEIGNKTAVAAVIKALESRERDVRQWVAEALGEHKRIEAVDELTRTLIFEDSGAAYRAAKILLQIGDEKAVDFMIKSLDSNDVLIKERAARALGMLKNHKAVDPLISMLNDEHANVRSRAAYALGEIRNGKAVAPLIQVLNDKNREVRENVVRALGVIADKRAVYPLSNALNDEDNQVREWALIALGKIGDEMASDALISALSDDDRDVRERAAYEAGQLGREESVDLLIKFLREGFKYGKRCVVEDSLGQVANEKAVNALIEALNSHDSSIRSGSAKALGQIGNEKATEAFIKALNSEDAGIRWHAARALEHVEENDLLKALEKSLKSKDHFTKRTAARVIGYYSLEPTLLDDLAQIAETEGIKEVRATAAVAKESFAHKLKIFGHMVTTGSMQPLSDTSTKEDVLVHEVGLLVSSAGHFFREFTKHDEGLDGEIEFRGEDGRGTGRRVYLQLKSGDSYLNVQKSGKEIFRISKPRHATYWASHAYPVFLVIRNSNGRIRWMNVTEYLNSRDSEVKQIEFQGSPFNIETIREMYLRYARE